MIFINTNQTDPNLFYREGIQINNHPATVFWHGEIWNVQTQLNRNAVAFKFIPGTVEVNYVSLAGQRIQRPIEYLNHRDGGAFYNQNYLNCNCHGFSLLGRGYWLNTPDVILEDEYMYPIRFNGVEEGVKYIVTWLYQNEYVHSGIYVNGMVWNKKNVRQVQCETLEAVNLSYNYCEMFFWRKLE